MPIREFILPKDLEELAQVAADSFQYPENPDWGIQEDEKDSLVESFHNLHRSWWMVRIGQLFVPSMRDLLNGLLWEENGKIVSMVMVQKRASSQNWIVGTVATLPGYRRRGYARKLVEGSLELMRDRGAEIAILDVIDANFPAYTLYQNLGFEHYTGRYEMEYKPAGVYPAPQMPAELTLEPTSLFNWQPRYELSKRIAPESIQTYDPTEPSLFRQPAFMRLFYPILVRAQKIRSEVFLIRHRQSAQVIGYLFLDSRLNNSGRHNIALRLDPDYAQFSSVILEQAIHHVSSITPDLFIGMSVFTWQQHVADAARELGFSQRVLMHRLGITL